ncbi:ADP-ribose pyrophosphatase [Ammoniphilus oxalaticus]|uniref:ADP-ribose pyrophosphatase n=1 Tax=Ammoniphilus oxalaticus TaxID=66863 RepID=A0A419SKF4_9BACL|nr:NUDIX hydrolase [Ammoniphilus oxalaticus]RKD24503.1 ADP-ribose pyrophosphatase [Ammoniphilus oxalaticus]
MKIPLRYDFCPKCGGKLYAETIEQQDQPRCSQCQFIFYQNPVVGVAGILLKDGKVLLGKRNNSYQGLWCLPCGYVEWKEDVEEACKREFEEETGLRVELERVYAVHSNFHNPQQHTVGIWYLMKEMGGQLAADDDLEQVDFFSYQQLPELAFPTDRKVLDQLAADGLLK